jgi:hypothetical protein
MGARRFRNLSHHHQSSPGPIYSCYSSSLGSLAVFGSNCGGSEDWQYDPFTAGGSQYVGRR